MADRVNEYRIGVTRRQEYVELTWKTELPTVPGLYWVYCPHDLFPSGPNIEMVEKHDSGYLGISNGDYLESLEEYSRPLKVYWMGPVPPPDLP